jgi:hypothetical protein
MLRDTLSRIETEYPAARQEPFADHQTATFIRGQAAEDLADALGELAPGLICVGRAGAGNWAEVPWLARKIRQAA